MPLSLALLRASLGCSVLAAVSAAHAQLPPPPVPSENPLTEAKRVLGKILFWDEQLSSDRTIACGSCHQAASGGSDPRVGVHPGPDELTPTPDDIAASPGVARRDDHNDPVEDPLFGFEAQVTRRAANSTLGAAYAPSLFWDGRATSTFVDPESGTTSIVAGGALESQAVGPIVSDVEMAHEGRDWDDVRASLARSLPLGDATDLPADVSSALSGNPSYGDLFEAAFGDPAISAERIAFAVATYERTLVPNQTPWDAFIAGDAQALTPGQVQGWNFFRTSPCSVCHTPPAFTNQTFRVIGLRPPAEDTGRQEVTGLLGDRGRFKVPTLRNVGLKPTHMHNGRVDDVTAAVLWYRPNNPLRSPDNLDPILPVGVPPQVLPALVDFLTGGLTDPRAASASFPFDQPTLHEGRLPPLSFAADGETLSWPPLQGVTRYAVYRGDLASLALTGPDGLPGAGYGTCIGSTGGADLADPAEPAPGQGFFYLKSVVDAQGAERGLGATSDGRARFVLAPCPD